MNEFENILSFSLKDMKWDINTNTNFNKKERIMTIEALPYLEYFTVSIFIPFYNRKVAGFWSICYDKLTGR